MEQLSAPFDGLIAALAPAQRHVLAKDIAFALRTSQAQRIGRQENVDGSRYEPRKPQKRVGKKTKNLRMFNKFRTMRFLRRRYSASEASVVIEKAAGIARVHQFGLHSNVGKGIRVKYPTRQLVGAAHKDLSMIENKIIDHLSEGFN